MFLAGCLLCRAPFCCDVLSVFARTDECLFLGAWQAQAAAGGNRAPSMTRKLLAFLLFLVLPVLAEVVLVHDVQSGDSVRLSNGERVRLFGLDAPELTQPYGKEAREWLARRVEGMKVKLETQGRDRYGRQLVVLVVNHRKVNQEMVAAGYAWWDSQEFPGEVDLERLQREAQQEKRGLWADPSPVPPWVFREQNQGK